MIHLLFCAVAVLIVCFAPRPATTVSRQVLSRLGRCRGLLPLQLVAVGLIGFCLCSVTAWLLFWPVPSVHDEFAYALTAQTFAQGKLTNPHHPFAEHFSSWHILVEPSYQGKYPPAQAVALAIGELLAGEMLLGVWLSFAVALASVYWASLPWLPRRWAMLTVVLIALNVPLLFAWGNSYWGGAVAMFGGSLLVGGWGRLRCTTSWIPGIAFGLGLGLLAASRPFEGALTAFPIGVAALIESIRSHRCSVWRFWLSAATSAATCAGLLLIYNQSVTGHLLTMPYQVWTAQQGEALDRLLTPGIVLVKGTSSDWETNAGIEQSEAPRPTADWRCAELAHWMKVRSDARFAFTWDKLLRTYAFYLQATLCLPLLAVPWMLGRMRGLVPMLLSVALVTLGCCLHLSAGHAHYVASLTVLLAILSVAGLRMFYVSLPSIGKPLLGAVLIAWLLSAGTTLAAEVIQQPHRTAHAWAKRRLALQEQLTAREQETGRKQIVFVRYQHDHNVHREWVYNRPDIDAAAVVFANDLGSDANAQLIQYYERSGSPVEPWLLEVSRSDVVLRPANVLEVDEA